MTQKLAIQGGSPMINRALAPFRSVGEEEAQAAAAVIRTGVLSAYIGARGDGFMGGPNVRAFEARAAEYFGVKHALGVNSWTSGLIAAIGAIGIEPGDEVITTPWTMAATATSILHWNAIPVFADIHPETFNIDPVKVERLISKRTKAVMAADIFGQSADISALRDITNRYGLKLICDSAQAPGALENGSYSGSKADIGGYSLNYHKHIHCGEGGILVTNDDRLASRMAMIRNHAEAVISSDNPFELANMIGFNFRMGEIEAAIANVQLEKLAERVASRQAVAAQLTRGLQDLPGVQTPVVAEGSTHAYYVYGLKIDPEIIGLTRDLLVDALRAEGVPGLTAGYQNLHLLPLFRHRIAYGSSGFPWNSPYCSRDIQYGKGTCPIAEELHARTFVGLNVCMNELPQADTELIVDAFRKVWSRLDDLRK